MKIAMIGQKGIPSRAGGVEIHVEEISKRLVSYGNDVTVYCRAGYCTQKYDEYCGINIKYIKSINTKHLDAITYTFISTIDAIIKNYDIIHYHALGPSLLSFLPKVFGKKVVCTCHGLDWKREKWGNFAKLMLKLGEKMALKFADKIISVSSEIKNYYKEQYRKEVVYIPNGVDNKNYTAIKHIYNKYDLKSDGYILFLARLVPEKGVHHLINAYLKLDTNKKLVIAGGSSHSDDYVEYLKSLSDNNESIIFTGFVSGDILEELFSNCYFYVLPSEIEGLPISLLEAMSYGQCCLVSNIKENIDVVEQYAEVFINKDSNSLYEKMDYLLKNQEVVLNYKKNSKQFILSKYNWDSISETTNELYKQLIKF